MQVECYSYFALESPYLFDDGDGDANDSNGIYKAYKDSSNNNKSNNYINNHDNIYKRKK